MAVLFCWTVLSEMLEKHLLNCRREKKASWMFEWETNALQSSAFNEFIDFCFVSLNVIVYLRVSNGIIADGASQYCYALYV